MPDHFTLKDVADGVYAALDAGTGAAVSNAAIIDTGDKTIIVDSFMTAQAAAELRSEAERLTGRGVFLVVNSHWHSDHVRGNQVFADSPIAATARTVELMVADAPKDLAAYEEELDGYIAGFRAKLESEDADERELARRRIDGLGELKKAAPGYRLTLPDLQFEDMLVIEGQQRVELHASGKGHTESDVYVWLPESRSVVAGDLCWNRIHPRVHDGFPPDWADVLRQMLSLEPDHVIPGHGAPGDAAVAQVMIPYMEAVTEVLGGLEPGQGTDEIPVPAGSEEWQGAERLRQGLAVIAER